jgi:hypothetical protein
MKRWLPLLLVACRSTLPADATPNDGGAGGAPSLAETYARAAAVAGSCMPDDGINRNLARFWDPLAAPNFFAQLRPQARCLATAGGGCAAVRTCLGYQLTVDGPACTTSCAGKVLTLCDEDGGRNLRLTIDCGKVGLSCDPQSFCTDGPSAACTSDTFAPACSAGRGSLCDDGRTARTARCEDLPLTCEAGQCKGTGAACKGGEPGAEGQVHLDGLACDGTHLRACVGGKEQVIDCAAQGEGQGFSCQTVSGQFFCGLAAECVPSESSSGTVTCDGSTVVICNAGRIQRVDCTALGFTGCEVDLAKGHYGCIPGLTP